jgi:hypothetical protein
MVRNGGRRVVVGGRVGRIAKANGSNVTRRRTKMFFLLGVRTWRVGGGTARLAHLARGEVEGVVEVARHLHAGALAVRLGLALQHAEVPREAILDGGGVTAAAARVGAHRVARGEA